MGGLPRRATFIKQETHDGSRALIVDSGNLFTQKVLSGTALNTAVKKGEMILRSMEAMGYQAAAVGEMDLYIGRENLDHLEEYTSVRLLSANLKSTNGKPVYTPYIIVKLGKMRIGVFGLTSRSVDVNLMEERFPNAWVDDPITVSSAIVNKLRKKSDLIVALTHIGFGNDRELAKKVDGIDIIVGGKSRTWMKNPVKVGNTLIVAGYFQGRAMGRLMLGFSGEHRGWSDGAKLDFLREQIQVSAKGGKTQPGVPSDQEALDKSLQKAASLTRYDGTMISLTSRFGDDRRIASMVRKYRKELKNTGKDAQLLEDAGDVRDRYTGAAPCKDCHLGRFEFWSGTAHAFALSTLKPRDADADPDCLPCHVTGYLRSTGYSQDSPRGDLVNVQCEACHGRGGLHISSPEQYRLIRVPAASVCRGCHIPDHDDDFDYFRDRSLVCEES